MALDAGMQKDDLKLRTDVHLSRKTAHMLGILGMWGIHSTVPPIWSWIILLTFVVLIIPLDFLRQQRPGLNRVTLRLLGPVMRRHESHQISGLSWLLLGTLLILALFEREIVSLTLLLVAIGDPVASFFGIRFGKDRLIGNKTLQGTMAAFVACTLVSMAFYYRQNIMTERLLIVSPISGMIGAIAELLPIGKLDDNFTFPVVSASLLWILFFLFGGFGL